MPKLMRWGFPVNTQVAAPKLMRSGACRVNTQESPAVTWLTIDRWNYIMVVLKQMRDGACREHTRVAVPRITHS